VVDETAAARRRLMAEGTRLLAEARALRDQDRTDEAFDLYDQVDEISQGYRDLLPEVTVARCPDSDEPVRWPIDTTGLDTWFWNYRAAVQHVPESPPRSWLAMTGAMRLVEPVEQPPFVVMPGPDVPFVVPRVLDSPGVRAVIAEVPVGRHTGWAITYFGPVPEVKLVNLWGSDDLLVYRDGEWTGWDRELPDASQYDFDLSGWLRSGKLLWLSPSDESATLRSGTDGCPFVDLPGRRLLTVVANGVVDHVETLPDR
jgi:hypothetical protein